MQSSQWTSDRLRGRIQDHLSWVAAAARVTPDDTPLTEQRRHRTRWAGSKALARKALLLIPFAGPVFVKSLRAVKAWLRTRRPSSGR